MSNGINIIPFVVSSELTSEDFQGNINNYFSLIPYTARQVILEYNPNEQELYTREKILELYRNSTRTSGPIPPVYFFDTNREHVNMMNMFRSFHITSYDSWKAIFNEIIALPPPHLSLSGRAPSGNRSSGGGNSEHVEESPLYFFPPDKQLGIGDITPPPSPRVGGRRRFNKKTRLRKTRKSGKGRKGSAKK